MCANNNSQVSSLFNSIVNLYLYWCSFMAITTLFVLNIKLTQKIEVSLFVVVFHTPKFVSSLFSLNFSIISLSSRILFFVVQIIYLFQLGDKIVSILSSPKIVTICQSAAFNCYIKRDICHQSSYTIVQDESNLRKLRETQASVPSNTIITSTTFFFYSYCYFVYCNISFHCFIYIILVIFLIFFCIFPKILKQVRHKGQKEGLEYKEI